MNRRSFITKATVAGSVLMGGAIFQSCKSSGNKSKPLMRLDSHIHLYDGGGNIDMIRQYFIDERLTHGQVIVRTRDLHLLPELMTISPGLIPFEWPNNPLELEVKEEIPVFGYKIHLRKPLNYEADGQPVTASSKALDPICTAAEKLGRPFLFHSDADTVLIGRDYPERSSNPRFKLDLMTKNFIALLPL